VRGRSSDNTLIKELLGWAPETSLQEGLAATYDWIYDQMTSSSTSVTSLTGAARSQ
jgi:GDP-D-mannose 3', 5'-epimerase